MEKKICYMCGKDIVEMPELGNYMGAEPHHSFSFDASNQCDSIELHYICLVKYGSIAAFALQHLYQNPEHQGLISKARRVFSSMAGMVPADSREIPALVEDCIVGDDDGTEKA